MMRCLLRHLIIGVEQVVYDNGFGQPPIGGSIAVHILVSGAKPDNGQGLPLPYIHDVPGLQRGNYPYGYECEWGRFKYEYELSAYLFTPHDGQVPPGWERYDLQTPIQPVTAVIDWARRLATVKTKDREIVLRDIPAGESPYSLLQQVNAALAQSCQPFVAWRLEWSAARLTSFGRRAPRRSATNTVRLT